MVPSHELAQQVVSVAKDLAHHAKFRCAQASKEHCERIFETPLDILVGTPAQIAWHRDQGQVTMKAIKHLVIDEADTLLEPDFVDRIEPLLSQLELDTAVLVMATVPKRALNKAKRLFPKLQLIVAPGLHSPIPKVRQHFVQTCDKFTALLDILKKLPEAQSALVFCHSIPKAERLFKLLSEHVPSPDHSKNIPLPSLLHGGMTLSGRASILSAFMNKKCSLLVTTDLAARGWDTPPHLRYVIQYDFAGSLAEYLHRAGRVGRCTASPSKDVSSGDVSVRGGRMISLVGSRDRRLAEIVMLATKQRRSFSNLQAL
jgi:superfamily II DNA/RNA helicase